MKRKLNRIIFFSLASAFGLMSCGKEYDPITPDATTFKSVSTLAPVHVTTTTADLGGSVTLAGNGLVLEKGIYLTDAANPLMPQSGEGMAYIGKKYVGQITDGNNFTVSLTGLKTNTKYKYIAFATTMGGTAYGEMKTLVTSFGTVEDEEGNIYQTVMIGDQLWMRENLKSTIYSDKSSISGFFSTESDYVYGKHYTYDAANHSSLAVKSDKITGACPTGWHVPSDAEFQTLLKYAGVPGNQISLGLFGDNQASQLKDGGAGHWSNPQIENSTGFSVLPAGICNPDKGDECFKTAFWTSTPNIFYAFPVDSEKFFKGNDEPDCTCGISIRCIKD
jgi:uncharacterized protein (TIGR02145 family)